MADLNMFDVTDMTDKDLSFLDKYDLVWAVTDEDVNKAFDELDSGPILQGLDTETTGLSLLVDELVGVTIAPSEKKSFYFPIAHCFDENVNLELFLKRFRNLCKTKKFVLFNAPFDWSFIKYKWDIDFEIGGDSQISAYVLDSNLAESGRLKLKHLMGEVFNIQPLELEEDLGITDFSLVRKEDALLYAAPDSIHALMLYNYYAPLIKEKKLTFIENLELKCIKPVGTLKINGCALDTSVLLSYKDDMLSVISDLEQKIYDLAGEKFDISSSQQMAAILYDKLKLPIAKNNTSRSVDKAALDFIQNKHPIVPLIQQKRLMTTSYENFVVKLPANIAEDSRIHANFNATGTRSGRFSSSGGFGKGGKKIKINLQQMPNKQVFNVVKTLKVNDEIKALYPEDKVYKKNEVQEILSLNDTGDEQIKYEEDLVIDVRSAFNPGPDHYYVSCDYSQYTGAHLGDKV